MNYFQVLPVNEMTLCFYFTYLLLLVSNFNVGFNSESKTSKENHATNPWNSKGQLKSVEWRDMIELSLCGSLDKNLVDRKGTHQFV